MHRRHEPPLSDSFLTSQAGIFLYMVLSSEVTQQGKVNNYKVWANVCNKEKN